ncbi:MAG: serine hydrolase domain-containing protein [Acidimicrobiales bacterium]
MTFDPLPSSTPSAQGVAPGGIERFLDALEAAPGVEPHSLMILRHGSVVASGWWSPYTPERPHLAYSLSKSFTSTAAGCAVADGLLRLDDPVIAYFPELDAEVTDPRSRAMLVRHVAAMSSGHVTDTWQQAMAADPEHPVRGFLQLPPDEEPGTVFAYNQSATYTLATIVQRVTGQTLTGYLRARILDPVGAGPVHWLQYPDGQDLGFSGLHATTDTVARLGELYLRGGTWQGRRLLPAAWVAEATRLHIPNATPGDPEAALKPDWQQGYGFQFWMSRHGFRGDGAYGQYCLVLPEQDAVVAMTGQSADMQAVLDAVWTELLPAFGPGSSGAGSSGAGSSGPGTEADGALAERLALLALPVARSAAAPATDPTRWRDTTFRPSGGTRAEQPSLTGVRLSSDGDTWHVVVEEAGAAGREEAGWELHAPLGQEWALASSSAPGPASAGSASALSAIAGSASAGAPVASSGGWTDRGELRADLVFLDTPHRLVLTCSLADGSVHARWVTTPLHRGDLRDMHAPG